MSATAIEDIYPLAPAQQGMFLRSLSKRSSGLYIEQTCLALDGPIDVAAFEGAWQQIMDRHAMLRTAFVAEDLNEPVQVVFRAVHLSIEWLDWSAFPPSDQNRRLEEYLAADRSKPFALGAAPLMRLALVRMQETVYQMIWTHHHLLLDGWSAALLMKEVSACYGALCRGEEWRPEPVQPYREYIVWLEGQDVSRAEAFWRRTLEGFTRSTPLGVPAGTAAHDQQEPYGFEQERLPASVTAVLQSAARDHHLTLNSFLQTAWAILLSRYSGEQDVLFGTTVSGRPAELPSVETMVGLFISTLPLRVCVRPEMRLRELLTAVQTRHLQARDYEYCSTGQVHQWSQAPGASPLYESILVFQNFPSESNRQSSQLAMENRGSSRFVGAHSEYPLTILSSAERELLLGAVYDGSRIDQISATCIVRHLLRVLTCMAEDPDARVAAVLEAVPFHEIPRIRRVAQPRGRNIENGFVPPQTATEKALAQLWTQVLGIAQVSIDDNFFDLQGHSLLAIQLMSRVRDRFRVELPINRLFEAPTVGQLSRAVEDAILVEIEALSEEEALRLVEGSN